VQLQHQHQINNSGYVLLQHQHISTYALLCKTNQSQIDRSNAADQRQQHRPNVTNKVIEHYMGPTWWNQTEKVPESMVSNSSLTDWQPRSDSAHCSHWHSAVV
jgi:hypothetical protein